jgi:hypothetical protein
MASISSRGAKNHHTYKLTLEEAKQSVTDNNTIINYMFELIDDGNWFWEGWNNSITYSISANGSIITSGSIPNHMTNNQTITMGSFVVPHNTDGKKSITYSFSVTDGANQYYTSGNASANGTMVLTAIPRYANFTKLEHTNVTEHSITINWDANAVCDSVAYSLNSGEWVYPTFSKTFVIDGLTADRDYTVSVSIKRADSQLWTEDYLGEISTYNYPYCTKSPDFIIGDPLTLNIYNPLNRNITIAGYSNDTGDEIFKGTSNGTSITGFNDPNSVNVQYSTIPNSQSGKYKVVVSYGNVAMTRDAGNSYRVRGNETPTINGFDYIDNNVTGTVDITQNEKQIVQNKSMLLARFHAATPNYGAGSIAQYYLECNGNKIQGSKEGSYELGTINSERDVDLTLTAVDSRGLSSSKTIKVTMLPHSDPNAIVTLQRLNNYEDETYLTVDGSISSVSDKNTMTVQYRYKASGGSYPGSFVTIGDNVKQTLSLDKNQSYIFQVVITDAFGSKYDKEHSIGKGVFPLFIDTQKNSVGINCFPAESNSLEVNGFNLFNIYKCCKNIYLRNSGGLKITIDGFGDGDKIPIIVVGADNASMIPVVTIVHIRRDGGRGHVNLGQEITVTGDGNAIHISASQWGFYSVYAPLGANITLSNSAL